MPLQPDEVYIKSVDEGRYTIIFKQFERKNLDYVDVIAAIMYSEGRKIHVFDPDYKIHLQHLILGESETGEYLHWLRRRANS